MTKSTANITSDESVELLRVGRGSDMDAYEATVFATGDFGSGTVTIQASPDGGTTKVTLRDVAGTIVSITSDDVYNVRLGYAGRLDEEIILYATMASSTNPDVVVSCFDNK